MLVLTIRTDNPQAEIGLFDDGKKLDYLVWEAHRALAETLNQKISELLNSNHLEMTSLSGIVVYSGPGSFTGLRIGLSVANALAYALQIPIAGIEKEESWLERGLESLKAGNDDKITLPEYGSPAYVTMPKS